MTYKPNQLIDPKAGNVRTTGQFAIQESRQVQEVKGAMLLARQFPRDENLSLQRIVSACSRSVALAEKSFYEYRRGGQQVRGPSIRLAEVLAANYQNLDYGIIELQRSNGESTVMTHCWDLESNVRSTKVFQVPHAMRLKDGTVKEMVDERDIYEHVANMGARRLRNCIMAIIPRDIIDAAVEACEKTLVSTKQGELPFPKRCEKMVAAFALMGVTDSMLKDFLGHSTHTISPQEMIRLRGIYTSIQEEASSVEDWFKPASAVAAEDAPKSPPKSKAAEIADKIKKPSEAAQEEPESAPDEEEKPAKKTRTRKKRATKKQEEPVVEAPKEIPPVEDDPMAAPPEPPKPAKKAPAKKKQQSPPPGFVPPPAPEEGDDGDDEYEDFADMLRGEELDQYPDEIGPFASQLIKLANKDATKPELDDLFDRVIESGDYSDDGYLAAENLLEAAKQWVAAGN